MRLLLALLVLGTCLLPPARAGESKEETRRLQAEKEAQINRLRTEIAKLEEEMKILRRDLVQRRRLLARLENAPTLGKQETQAVKRLRYVACSQQMFRRTDWDKDGKPEYAVPYTQLLSAKDPKGKVRKLIPDTLAAASGEKGTALGGYLFRDVASIGGKKLDPATGFALCATPAKYGENTRMTFIMPANGSVWAKDLGKSDFVDDAPADPIAEGWKAIP